MPDREVEGQQPAVVVEPDGDLVDLPALVGARDEMFAPVLDPLDLAGDPGLPQLAGGPGDHDLLGPRVDDLHTETTTDVGAMQWTLLCAMPSRAAIAARADVEVWVDVQKVSTFSSSSQRA